MAVWRILPVGDVELIPTEDGLVTPYLVSGVQFIRQKIAQRLKFWLGEWFLDIREGVPYRTAVFIKNPDLDVIRSVFRSVILSVEGVVDLDWLSLTYDAANRVLAVEFYAHLVEDETLLVRQPDEPFIITLQRNA